MKLYPKAPKWHDCSKTGHCVHRVEGKGYLCCKCPVRAEATEIPPFNEARHKFPEDPARPWSMNFDVPTTKAAQDEVYYFRKRMEWPWPCQNGCGKIAESPESYYCDDHPPCELEKSYVVGTTEEL